MNVKFEWADVSAIDRGQLDIFSIFTKKKKYKKKMKTRVVSEKIGNGGVSKPERGFSPFLVAPFLCFFHELRWPLFIFVNHLLDLSAMGV